MADKQHIVHIVFNVSIVSSNIMLVQGKAVWRTNEVIVGVWYRKTPSGVPTEVGIAVGTGKCPQVYQYEVSQAGCRFAKTTEYLFDFNCEKPEACTIP